jgi:CubicO group peptidase (beta-lactamase class C family)
MRGAYVPVPRDLSAITRLAPEVAGEEVGLPAGAVERIWAAVERLYRTGTQPAIALCVRRKGRVVLDRSIGHARGNAPTDASDAPKVVATPDTPFCIFSASKAITAMIVHLLDDRGLLHVNDRVTEYLPRFARHGKSWVTIRHVLTHRAGIPSLGSEDDLPLLFDRDALVERLCDARPESAPGRRLAYHAISGGFVLGEIVRRVSGKPVEDVLRDEILRPLGFRGLTYGWPADRLDELAVNAYTGPPEPLALRPIARKALGVSFERAAEVANSVPWLTSVVPSGNVVATANEASRFFQLLLDEGTLDGVKVFEGRTLRRAVTETAHRELDFTMLLPVRYGEGLMLGSRHLGLFGPDTEQAFGHLGFSNIFCWADPERRTSVALLTSGKPLISPHVVALGRLLSTMSSAIPKVR